MERTKLYCPPSGDFPQELPDYWRFDNNVIRRDLQTIEDEELHAWGWTGPFYMPIAKMVIDNINLKEIGEDKYQNLLEEFNIDTQNNKLVSKNYDYDPETHKLVWYSEKREFIILPIEQDVHEYTIPFKSNVTLPEPSSEHEIYTGTCRKINYKSSSNPYSTRGNIPILWNKFKITIIKLSDFNEYMSSVMKILPIVANLLPVAIINLDKDSGENFKMVWKLMKEIIAPPQDLKNNIISIAKECNLPQEFIDEIK